MTVGGQFDMMSVNGFRIHILIVSLPHCLIVSSPRLAQKHGTLHQCVGEIPHAVAVLRAGIEHRFDVTAVGELHGGAGGIERELVQEIPRKLAWVGGEEGFQVVNVGERTTVSELTAGIHFAREGEGKVVTGAVDAGDAFAIAGAAITRAPGTEDIEVFKCETDRIKLRVAGGAGGGFRVLGDEFTNGFCTANVRLYGRNTWWWRRRMLTNETIHDPFAAQLG